MLFTLSVPPDNDRGPQYMEQVLAALHQGNVRRHPVEFCFARHAGTVCLACRTPRAIRRTLETQLAAHYPDSTIARLDDAALDSPPASPPWSALLRLRPDLFPIRRYGQFDDPANRNASDPLTSIFAALSATGDSSLNPRIILTVRPAAAGRVRAARATLARLSSPFCRTRPRLTHILALAASSNSFLLRLTARTLVTLLVAGSRPLNSTPLSTSTSRAHEKEDDLAAAADKLRRHLFEVHLRIAVSAPPDHASRAARSIYQLAAAFGQFTLPGLAAFHLSPLRRLRSTRLPRRGFLLSCEELATLWHPATGTVRAPAMRITESRELEPPVHLPTPNDRGDVAVLGRTAFRSRREPYGIRLDDRRRHLAIVGKTGMGKTTLLHRLLACDIRAGRGVALIDPHGDLADRLLACVPTRRTNDVVLLDAGDQGHPLAFNPLDCPRPADRPLAASGVVAAFKKLYGDSWGPRLEHILRNATLALLDVPGSSFLSLQRMLTDAAFRATIVARLGDPVVRAFWTGEFASWRPQYRAEAVAPILNKVGQFLSQPVLRAIVGQPRTRLDLRRVIDEGKILLVNLSKGRIGEDASSLLGSLLVSGLQLAAMSRADVPEDDRRDYFLTVDEFQNFATESFTTILSEARKYRLALTVAHQYLAQLPEDIAAALFGNVGSLVAFQVGASDAEQLAAQLGGDITPQDLVRLPRFSAYARLLIDGMPSRPFSMATLPPPSHRRDFQRPEVIRRASRRRYARSADHVGAEVAAAMGAGPLSVSRDGRGTW